MLWISICPPFLSYSSAIGPSPPCSGPSVPSLNALSLLRNLDSEQSSGADVSVCCVGPISAYPSITSPFPGFVPSVFRFTSPLSAVCCECSAIALPFPMFPSSPLQLLPLVSCGASSCGVPLRVCVHRFFFAGDWWWFRVLRVRFFWCCFPRDRLFLFPIVDHDEDGK